MDNTTSQHNHPGITGARLSPTSANAGHKNRGSPSPLGTRPPPEPSLRRHLKAPVQETRPRRAGPPSVAGTHERAWDRWAPEMAVHGRNTGDASCTLHGQVCFGGRAALPFAPQSATLAQPLFQPI